MPNCPNPPWYPNGSWCGYQHILANISNSTDPISGTAGPALHTIPIIPNLLIISLYVFLWVRFGRAPSRFKLVGMTALVFVISIIVGVITGGPEALLNFALFGLAYFLSFLFKG